ncbi:MAG: squalene/phytoene synthase family protein [Hyphomicrobiaceae bacterium]
MRGEADRYIAATLAPRGEQPALAALAAFAAEVARIPASVSEPALGDIRLQWWRDALAEGRAGRRSGHPVADALVASVERYGLAADLLEAVIDARELDLAGGMPQDAAGLVAYLDASESHVFLLALNVLGATGPEIEDLARQAGWAYGVARGLGRLPMLLHNGGVILPADALRAEGIDPARIAAKPVPQDVDEAVRQVQRRLEDEARERLSRVRKAWIDLDRRMRPALLPLAMVEPYLRAQSRRQILVEPAEISPLRRVASIGLAHLTGRL